MTPQRASLLLALAAALSVLSFAAVQAISDVRAKCRIENLPLKDGFGQPIEDGFSQPITIGRELSCEAEAVGVRVEVPLWSAWY